MRSFDGYRTEEATGMMIEAIEFGFQLTNIQTGEVREERFDTYKDAQAFLLQHDTMYHDHG